MEFEERLISYTDLIALLGVSRTTADLLRRAGKLPPTTLITNRRRYRVGDVVRWMQERHQAHSAAGQHRKPV